MVVRTVPEIMRSILSGQLEPSRGDRGKRRAKHLLMGSTIPGGRSTRPGDGSDHPETASMRHSRRCSWCRPRHRTGIADSRRLRPHRQSALVTQWSLPCVFSEQLALMIQIAATTHGVSPRPGSRVIVSDPHRRGRPRRVRKRRRCSTTADPRNVHPSVESSFEPDRSLARRRLEWTRPRKSDRAFQARAPKVNDEASNARPEAPRRDQTRVPRFGRPGSDAVTWAAGSCNDGGEATPTTSRLST